MDVKIEKTTKKFFISSVIGVAFQRLLRSQSRAERRRRCVPQAHCRRQRSTNTEKKNIRNNGCLASVIGVEPTAFRLGVDSEPPKCSKIGNFLANRTLLCVFFVSFALFFMFQASIFISFSNFYAKIYAKTMLF